MSRTTPAIVGFLVVGALLLAVGFLLGNRDGSDARVQPPALRVLAPASGDSVENPVVLTFRTTAPLELGAAGWAAGDLHLHAMVDDTEHMPAGSDITAGDSIFTWQLPPLHPGAHRIHLTWAARHHGNMIGRTDTVRVHVRR